MQKRGLRTIEFPLPTISVGSSAPQPIVTRYGWTDDIPARWQNRTNTVFDWENDSGEACRYSGAGEVGAVYCTQDKSAVLAISGTTGRDGVDPATAAAQHVRLAERLFSSDDSSRRPRVEYVQPQRIVVGGRPLVHDVAIAGEIPFGGA
ncbi:hypothetical protein ACWEVD_18795 [Nocardia thailandica]